MYAEWTSLEPVIPAEQRNWSVLNKFPSSAGKDVSIAVVKHLAANLGINSVSAEQPSNLENDREVQWCLEVLCFGLSLPLSETEAIKDCVNVYCEWLTALTKPNVCVPKPIIDDPNNYGKRMIKHLYNLFVPRKDSTADQIQRQILFCHRVLRSLQKIAHESIIIAHDTWERMLLLLLSVNDTLLAPPVTEHDLGDHLCERILGVLFEVWLISCGRCFPSPALWKTFREMSCRWRHRVVLINQWNRINIVLTSRILSFMFGSNFPELKCGEEDFTLVPGDISSDCVSQTWFRFLHLIGNPIDLCKPGIISQTPRFFHYALSSESVIDPWQHSCLMALPLIFLKAMKGVSTLVNAFLGIQISAVHIEELIRGDKMSVSTTYPSSAPPDPRKIVKNLSAGSTASKNASKSINVSTGKVGSSQAQPGSSSQPSSAASTPNSNVIFSSDALLFSQEGVFSDTCQPTIPGHPRCNSVLHLFGAWLFEASLLGCNVPTSTSGKMSQKIDESDGRIKSSSVFFDQKTSSVGMSSLPDSAHMPEGLSIDKFEAGQAEAIGALCRIICSKKTAEDILPVYLARFYLAIKLILCDKENIRGQVISSILLNSHNLFKQNIDGVHVLYPAYFHALEMVLFEASPKFKLHPLIQVTDLRRASIHILLSLLCLPLHYINLPIKDIACGERQPKSVTFQSLKPKLINLMIGAIKVETDAVNTQMLLGGLLLFVQDCSAFEEVQQITVQNPSNSTSDSIANLLDLDCSISSDSSVDHKDRPQSMPTPIPSLRLHPDSEGLEYPDFDMLSSSDSAYSLYVRATYLVCHKLISSWKTDLNISLAAIELLAGLAKLKFSNQETLECKRAVKWISDFIIYQCSRPPPAHSKDLHSTIVAAYFCLTIWLMEHPHLLNDKECLMITFEVVELGISGSKSQQKWKDVPKMKAEKENKPVSMRVRDAAESVLITIMTQVGYFPSKCGPESLSSLLNEESLFRQCNNWISDTTPQQIAKTFRYYVLANSIILAVMEQSLGNYQDPQPTVTVLIRGPFGRNAWTIQQRHFSHKKSGLKTMAVDPGRPLPMNDLRVKNTTIPQYFPDSIDRIPSCHIDKSIPSLDSVTTEKKGFNFDRLTKLIHEQTSFESSINDKDDVVNRQYPNPETECQAPPLCQEFQTARLFLSQFGFLSLDALKESLTQPTPSLVMLDQTQPNFLESLASLDKMSDRTSDTVFIFYVKSNQKKATDILQNVVNKSNVNPHFLEFLHSLGWPVNVEYHSGWTGHASTSWKIINDNLTHDQQSKDKDTDLNHGGSLYDGKKQLLYWSDVTSEMAFIVPSSPAPRKSSTTSLNTTVSSVSQDSEAVSLSPQLSVKSFDHEVGESGGTQQPVRLDNKPRAFSLDLDKSTLNKEFEQPNRSSGRRYGRQGTAAMGWDAKVVVVWLESYEDHAHFPLAEILQHAVNGFESGVATPPRTVEKDIFVICIHSLQSGLYRMKMQANMGKISLAIPLVDGMVVSRRILGTMVRQTALNICRRRRLELESYQPPHVRRKLMIQDIVQKFKSSLNEPQFYSSLFV